MEKIKYFAKHVFKTLGAGFSERVYHNAIEVLLKKNNICFLSEHTIPVMFEGVEVGTVRADLVVNEKFVVELKVRKTITDRHSTQCFMYMKLLNIEDGIVINFPDSDEGEVEFEEISSVSNCKRCGRDNHTAQSCYARTHAKGYVI